ncbi:hypothetical protein OC846_000320 [Tilletia horrida]|uniref:Phospholipase/carboxylesterase/thioesterase domain-containing protein n=1 Tax=Tilletia horrida TaxID=155126 RepID=A0AAN6K125_9BASI|nr:hypothetical protein OC845_001274 [Tilletia horrida]KAK0557753.1 hypothetical protein OC846_000320 [Tilletia horrida]KAK0570273.1 hypothetical protein OC861_000016 [Tilletia horrida]
MSAASSQDIRITSATQASSSNADSEPARKPAPSPSHPALRPFKPFLYLDSAASSSSTPLSNLLILLPGLGDSPKAYASLATQFQRTLPQTAILILRPTDPIPFLAEPDDDPDQVPQAWWNAFDTLTGDTLPPSAQNPGPCIDRLSNLLDYLAGPIQSSPSLSSGCGWPPHAIHLFGYGQGGTAALETAIAWTRKRRIRSGLQAERELGSIVSVCGPLLSSSGGNQAPKRCAIPILSVVRHPNADTNSVHATSERKRLRSVFDPAASKDTQLVVFRGNGDAMLQGKAEFDVLMKFWSSTATWRNRSSWEVKDEGVYRVV